MHPLFMVGIAPTSWRLGVVRYKPGVKIVLGLGPLRVAFHWVN
jgi:hypothetical protein